MSDVPMLLDATGLKCPLPVLKARRALKALPAGGLLEVRADDPAAPKDFEAFCRTTGDELVSAETQGDAYVFVIRRRGG